MGRIICLDIGEKRIGIAVSDPMFITAQGVETYNRKAKEEDAEYIRKKMKEYDADKLLAGLPYNMNGTLGPQAEKVIDFVSEIERKTGVKAVYSDERLTTKAMERILIEADVSRAKRKNVIDKLAAVSILQNYLDSIKNKGEKAMEKDNIIELVDDKGEILKLEHILTFENNDTFYAAFLPVDSDMDEETDEVVIMRMEQDGKGEDVFVPVEDDEELDSAWQTFLDIYYEDGDDGDYDGYEDGGNDEDEYKDYVDEDDEDDDDDDDDADYEDYGDDHDLGEDK